LPPEVVETLEDLVGRLKGAGIHLEGALGLDEVDQLADRVDVGRLEVSLPDQAHSLPGPAVEALPGRGRRAIDGAPGGLQSGGIHEARDLDLTEGLKRFGRLGIEALHEARWIDDDLRHGR